MAGGISYCVLLSLIHENKRQYQKQQFIQAWEFVRENENNYVRLVVDEINFCEEEEWKAQVVIEENGVELDSWWIANYPINNKTMSCVFDIMPLLQKMKIPPKNMTVKVYNAYKMPKKFKDFRLELVKLKL